MCVCACVCAFVRVSINDVFVHGVSLHTYVCAHMYLHVCVWQPLLDVLISWHLHNLLSVFLPLQHWICVFILNYFQIGLTLEAEELLPAFVRRRFVTRTRVVYPNRRLGPFDLFKEAVWGAARWDSIDNIRKYAQMEVVSDAVEVCKVTEYCMMQQMLCYLYYGLHYSSFTRKQCL